MTRDLFEPDEPRRVRYRGDLEADEDQAIEELEDE
jgi:hypothetical protein